MQLYSLSYRPVPSATTSGAPPAGSDPYRGGYPSQNAQGPYPPAGPPRPYPPVQQAPAPTTPGNAPPSGPGSQQGIGGAQSTPPPGVYPQGPPPQSYSDYRQSEQVSRKDFFFI